MKSLRLAFRNRFIALSIATLIFAAFVLIVQPASRAIAESWIFLGCVVGLLSVATYNLRKGYRRATNYIPYHGVAYLELFFKERPFNRDNCVTTGIRLALLHAKNRDHK